MNYWATPEGQRERAQYSVFVCEHMEDDGYCQAPASQFWEPTRCQRWFRCRNHVADLPDGVECRFEARMPDGGIRIDEALDR